MCGRGGQRGNWPAVSEKVFRCSDSKSDGGQDRRSWPCRSALELGDGGGGDADRIGQLRSREAGQPASQHQPVPVEVGEGALRPASARSTRRGRFLREHGRHSWSARDRGRRIGLDSGRAANESSGAEGRLGATGAASLCRGSSRQTGNSANHDGCPKLGKPTHPAVSPSPNRLCPSPGAKRRPARRSSPAGARSPPASCRSACSTVWPRRPGTADANASRAPCLAVAQIERIVVRSIPNLSASSLWVADEVTTEVKISYFCDGVSRLRRGERAGPAEATAGGCCVVVI